MTLLKEVFTSSGYSSEKIYIYLAEDLEEGIRHLDDTEEINEIVRLSIDDAMEHVLNNELPAACENLALLTYYYKFME
jgi:ADP-ribose pyrophosphatase